MRVLATSSFVLLLRLFGIYGATGFCYPLRTIVCISMRSIALQKIQATSHVTLCCVVLINIQYYIEASGKGITHKFRSTPFQIMSEVASSTCPLGGIGKFSIGGINSDNCKGSLIFSPVPGKRSPSIFSHCLHFLGL